MSVRVDLRWKKFPVLDDGSVSLVDVMGKDNDIAEAARVSYGEGTRSVSDDRTLIRYLMRHRHSTPFEMAEVKLFVRVPMDCWRQWIRHRTANVNEYSTRYSVAIDSAQMTHPDDWRAQSTTNRQGSGGGGIGWPSDAIHNAVSDTFGPEATPEQYLSRRESAFHDMAKKVYRERIDAGVAREQARKDLPLSTYTEAYWKIDLHNLFHFLSLRMDSHAQKEIREYATIIGKEIVAPLFPLAWEAFCDYRLNTVTFSGPEITAIGDLLRHAGTDPVSEQKFRELFPVENNREREEFEAKLGRIGFPVTRPHPEPLT